MEKAISAITRNKQDLVRLEGIIQKNIGAFYELGRALTEIRDKGYYRDVLGYETFEEYCKTKWDFNSSRARQLISATETVDNIKSVTIVTPANEGQARPLAKLDPKQQREAWAKAIETAPEGKVTAAHVYRIVKGMTGDDELKVLKKAERSETNYEMRQLRKFWRMACDQNQIAFASWIKREEKKLPVDAITYAEVAMGQLERISDDDPAKDEALAMVEDWIKQHRNGGSGE